MAYFGCSKTISWPPACREIRLHDLRHTAATLQLQQGTHPRIVQEMLGHSSIALTLGTYSHVTGTMQRDAADELDVAFSRERSKKTS